MSDSLPSRRPDGADGSTLAAWAAGRAPLLVALGVLFALVAVLIVVSLLHPR